MLLTPAGTGAIAVVRLVGGRTPAFLERHFSRTVRAGRCVHGALRDGDRVLDDPVVVVSGDGRIADLNLHGGAWVVASVLELARRHGFEVLEPEGLIPPELAFDAVSPLEVEVLTHLPLARTEPALRILLAQPAAWEAFVHEATPARIASVLSDRSLWSLLHPPRVAIVGAPNVGKSTLANQLFSQERSITADLPGTTRDWVGEIANLDGLPVLLVDTPGLRATADPIEHAAIARSGAVIESADAVLLVLDASRPIEGEQRDLLDRFPDAIRVLNKADRVRAGAVALTNALRTIATSGQGVDGLRLALRARFGCADLDPNRPRWWTPRQREVLTDALRDVRRLGEILTPRDETLSQQGLHRPLFGREVDGAHEDEASSS